MSDKITASFRYNNSSADITYQMYVSSREYTLYQALELIARAYSREFEFFHQTPLRDITISGCRVTASAGRVIWCVEDCSATQIAAIVARCHDQDGKRLRDYLTASMSSGRLAEVVIAASGETNKVAAPLATDSATNLVASDSSTLAELKTQLDGATKQMSDLGKRADDLAEYYGQAVLTIAARKGEIESQKKEIESQKLELKKLDEFRLQYVRLCVALEDEEVAQERIAVSDAKLAQIAEQQAELSRIATDETAVRANGLRSLAGASGRVKQLRNYPVCGSAKGGGASEVSRR